MQMAIDFALSFVTLALLVEMTFLMRHYFTHYLKNVSKSRRRLAFWDKFLHHLTRVIC